MSHDPMFIAIVYRGPKRFRGNRCKTVTLPLGAVSYSDMRDEVTFSAPKFLAAVSARYVAKMVSQEQFDFASDAEREKFESWQFSRSPSAEPLQDTVTDEISPEEEEEIHDVKPPSREEIERELAAAHSSFGLEADLVGVGVEHKQPPSHKPPKRPPTK